MDFHFQEDRSQIRDLGPRLLSEAETSALLAVPEQLPPAYGEILNLMAVTDYELLNRLRAEAINDGRMVPFGLVSLARAQENTDGVLVPISWQAEAQLRSLLFEEVDALGLAAYQRQIYPSAWYTGLVQDALHLPAIWLPMVFVFVGAPSGLALGQEYFEVQEKRKTHGENWID